MSERTREESSTSVHTTETECNVPLHSSAIPPHEHSSRDSQVYLIVTVCAIAINLFAVMMIVFVLIPATTTNAARMTDLTKELKELTLFQQGLAEELVENRKSIKRFNVAIERMEALQEILKKRIDQTDKERKGK